MLVVLLGVWACVTDDRYLPALLEDPMAHVELPGTELIRRSERPEGEGLLGRSSALVQQVLRILNPDEADALLLEAVEYAESVGWVFDEDQPSQSGLWRGTKTIDEGRMRVGLSLGSEDGIPTLIVNMAYEVRS